MNSKDFCIKCGISPEESEGFSGLCKECHEEYLKNIKVDDSGEWWF